MSKQQPHKQGYSSVKISRLNQKNIKKHLTKGINIGIFETKKNSNYGEGLIKWIQDDNNINTKINLWKITKKLFEENKGSIENMFDLIILPGTDDDHKYPPGESIEKKDILEQTEEYKKINKINITNFYFEVIEYFFDKTPIYGVCAGLQAIDLYFGGTLQPVKNHNGVDYVHKSFPQKMNNLPKYIFSNEYSMHLTTMCDYCINHDKTKLIIDMFDETDTPMVAHVLGGKWPCFGLQFHPELEDPNNFDNSVNEAKSLKKFLLYLAYCHNQDKIPHNIFRCGEYVNENCKKYFQEYDNINILGKQDYAGDNVGDSVCFII